MISNIRQTPINAAGGSTHIADGWTLLERFLVLGTYGTYYADPKKQTVEMSDKLIPVIKEDPERFLQTCVQFSVDGRAPKSEPIAVALALLWKHGVKGGTPRLRQLYKDALPKVLRIGTHLFEWVAAMDAVGAGWGPAVRKAGSTWYHARAAEGNLSYQMAKYQQRRGWSHHDVLHMLHTAPQPEEEALFRWAKTGDHTGTVGHVFGMATLGQAEDVVEHIKQYRLTHEMIPNELKSRRDVWEALLPTMPYMAMVRNLNRLTNLGLVKDQLDWFLDRIQNVQVIKASRVHPFQLLLAWDTYGRGRGIEGSLTWTPNPKVVRSLEAAFYAAFKTVEPTGKRYLLAYDVSASMTWDSARLLKSHVTAAQASCALGMVSVAAEGTDNVDVVVFSGGLNEVDSREFHDRNISQVWTTLSQYHAGRTDCSLPFTWAQENGRKYDAIIIYTDSMSNAHTAAPSSCLARYREISPDCRAIIVAMAANENTLVPEHPLNLNMAGFDSSGPSIISSFVGGPSVPIED